MDSGAHTGPEPSGALALLRRMLSDRIVVFDGAMGTMLHAAGAPLDRSLCELNLSQPQLVRDLHAAYVAAGADIVQTNTFDANRLRLARFGVEDSVVEINIAGARLAREAVQHADRPVLVAGSVGPATSASVVPRVPVSTRADTLREQIATLCDWVDLLVLETYGDIESLAQAVEVAQEESDLPVIAQLTFADDGRTLRGEYPGEVAAALGGLDLAALGANCTVGPAVLQDVVAELAKGTSLPVSVQPNAGVPVRLGRRVRYARNTDYFAHAARQFVANGANLLGGCCGTTPAHIRAIAGAVAGLTPTREAVLDRADGDAAASASGAAARSRLARVAATPGAEAQEPPAAWPAAGRFAVIGGLSAPHGKDVGTFVEQGQQLRAAGAELLAITDPAAPRTRVNPVAAGVVLRERVGAEVLLPVETVDRSLAVLQADLLGAHALGLRLVVCRTGVPRVLGDYPDPEMLSLWDVDSVKLIGTLRGLNEGVDYRGMATADTTRFVIGGSVSVVATDERRELERAEAKVNAGAHFLVTDVVYDGEQALRTLVGLRDRGIAVPVLAAVAPFADVTTLERLSHEIPEVTISPATLAAVRRTSGRPDLAVAAALDVVEQLRGLTAGVAVHVPPEHTAHGVELIGAIAAKVGEGDRR